jgi:hypothetical protein
MGRPDERLRRRARREHGHRALLLWVTERTHHQDVAPGVKLANPREVSGEMHGRLGQDIVG